MTAAVFEAGGKQYTAKAGDVLNIALTEGKVGSKIVFDKVLSTFSDGKANFGSPYLKGKTVEAKILKHDKAKKIIVFKFKKTKGYQRKQGHRQDYTQIEITKIA